MTKWRYTLLGWLVWRLWKRRLRGKLGLAPESRIRRWATIGVCGLAVALVLKRLRRRLRAPLMPQTSSNGRDGKPHEH
jgi:hypothetical protein